MSEELRASEVEIADFQFVSGAKLPTLRVAFWTMGSLNKQRDNVLLLCHGSSGGKEWALPYCRADGAFNPKRYFVISVDMPGGGGSSRRRTDAAFPDRYDLADLVAATVALLDALNIDRVAGFAGPSMASLIGLDLAFRYPDRIGALALWTGGNRSDGFARAVTEGVASVLSLDSSSAGIRAAVLAILPALFGRQGLAQMTPDAAAAVSERVAGEWERAWQADELAARYRMMGAADLPRRHGGEERLAAGITAPLLLLQASSDQIFETGDVAPFIAKTPRARMDVLETGMGHLATAAPPGSAEFDFFDAKTASFFEETAPC